MNNDHITASVTLKLDEKWASTMDQDELKDYIKSRVDYVMGFRGRVGRIRLSKPS